MKKKNDNIEIIDNGNGSKSALIKLEQREYRELAKGSMSNTFNFGGADLFEVAAAMSSQTGITRYPVCGGTESGVKNAIKKSLYYWESEPIVYKCIQLLAELTNDTFTISSEDKKVEKEVRSWWSSIKGSDFLTAFFLEFFRSGNVPVLRTDIKYVPRNGFKGSDKKISGGYTILNPLNITIKDSGIPGIKEAYLMLGSDFQAILKNSSNIQKIKNVFPSEIFGSIDANTSEIILPKEMFSMVTKDKQPYELWAYPLTAHAFDYLDYKRQLFEMDKATVNGVKNRILKVTIGSDTFPVTDDKELKRLASKFNNPSKNLTIFWNHTLKIEYIEPSFDSLSMEKYNPIMDDIRSVYGISKVLMGNAGSSSSDNTLSLKGLLEILDTARSAFISWFFREVNDVANTIANTKEDEVSISFGSLNLKDVNDYFRVLMQMVDRQIVSYETAMETIGYYFPKEIKRLESEQKLREEKGILITQTAPTQGSDSPTTNNQGGRPKGATKESSRPAAKNKKKTPVGIKSVSSLVSDVSIAFASDSSKDEIAEVIKRSISSMEITDEDKSFLSYLVDSCADKFKDLSGTKEFIENVLEKFLEKYEK